MNDSNHKTNTRQRRSFGPQILERSHFASWTAQEQRNRQMLSHALNLRDTIVFAGAGCSVPFDYPDWGRLSLVEAISAVKQVIPTEDLFSSDKYTRQIRELDERAQSFSAPLSPKPSSADKTFALGVCEKICREAGYAKGFREKIAMLFKSRASRQNCAMNPYMCLSELPVHRFITSNYDCQLEEALVAKKGLLKQDYFHDPKGFGKKSFAQTPAYDEQLAAFSLAFVGYEPRVFHCHGWHCEPESMVLTERDYQEWYFRDQAIGGRYRQTIDLIFNSNPLLFIGFSLSDDDLLIPLRFLSAVDRENKHSRPLFALVERNQLNNESRFEQLYDRYGIHVISYEMAEDEAKDVRTQALCKEIKAIGQRCKDDRKSWLQKPPFRSVLPTSSRNLLLHYKPDTPHQGFAKATDKDRSDFWSNISGIRVGWIVGPSGTGKSWEAIQELQRLHKIQQHNRNGRKTIKQEFSGFLFWSFRHSNDALSGIERTLRFMGSSKIDSAEDSLNALVEVLCKRRYLIVFDGIERFLHHNTNQGTVDASNRFYERFLLLLRKKANTLKSTIVLISRELPSIFESFTDERNTKRITVQHSKAFSVEQIGEMLEQSAAKHRRAEVTQYLYSWFQGHRYAVSLAAEWLKEKDANVDAFARLEYEMAEADPEHRVSKMIGLSLRAIREMVAPKEDALAASRLLERLAVSVEPVNQDVAKCYLDESSKRYFEPAINLLVTKKLLFQVEYYDGSTRYMVHPSIREYIFYREHHSSPADLPSFSLSGFTSAGETVYPGDRQSSGKKVVVDLFESLIDREFHLQSKEDEQCRAAFGIVRSRMVASTVSRWSRYDEYLRILVKLIDFVRGISEGGPLWTVAAIGADNKCYLSSDAVLFGDELAWLYNEVGLAYYGQGSMVDAIAVWEQSYEINKFLDGDRVGHHVFQSLCNLGGAYIHFGRLRKAERYLQKAIEMGRKLGEEDHITRIKIYLALLSHLRGNIGAANEQYKIVTEALKDLGNMRAYSIALRHHADLLLKRKSTRAEAWEKIQTCKAIAEANSYHDLVAYARLSYGHLHRVERKFPDAIREYRVALDLARTMGIRRLEAEAQSELARVDLDLGDSQVARRRAMKALQIANENLLGLRQTHCLVILGKSTIDAGERELGVHYLRFAKRLADTQEYRLRANEAEAALFEIGEPIQNSGIEADTSR